MGKTEAVKLGIERAIGDILIIQDADLEYDPIYYPQLIEPVIKGGEYVVYGSMFKGSIKRMNFIRLRAENHGCKPVDECRKVHYGEMSPQHVGGGPRPPTLGLAERQTRSGGGFFRYHGCKAVGFH